ncbi:MAG: SprT-like domain-containing protein [Flavobacteriaceae bacterium]
MDRRLESYLPKAAVPLCEELLAFLEVEVKVVNIRTTRHGDNRKLSNGRHLITLNATKNPYRFLMTCIHEIAHLMAFSKYGRRIKPHGKEWKTTFQHLMLPFLKPDIFPAELLPLLAHHLKNPKASSTTDSRLALAFRGYDPPSDAVPVMEIPQGGVFKMYNGRRFKRGDKRVKRIECVEISTGRLYLFQPNAEVERIKDL